MELLDFPENYLTEGLAGKHQVPPGPEVRSRRMLQHKVPGGDARLCRDASRLAQRRSAPLYAVSAFAIVIGLLG